MVALPDCREVLLPKLLMPGVSFDDSLLEGRGIFSRTIVFLCHCNKETKAKSKAQRMWEYRGQRMPKKFKVQERKDSTG